MISFIRINGFKSFVHFEMDFTPFTAIAGFNTSRKNDLLDALKMLSGLATTSQLPKLQEEYKGRFADLFTHFDDSDFATEMEFVVELMVDKVISDAWGNKVELKYTRFRYEITLSRAVDIKGDDFIFIKHEKLATIDPRHDRWQRLIPANQLHKWQPTLNNNEYYPVCFEAGMENGEPVLVIYSDDIKRKEGSSFSFANTERTVLSSIKSVDYAHIFAVKEEMSQWCKKGIFTVEQKEISQFVHKIKPSGLGNSDHISDSVIPLTDEEPKHLTEIDKMMRRLTSDLSTLELTYSHYAKKFLFKMCYNDGSTHYTGMPVLTKLSLSNPLHAGVTLQSGLQCIDEPEKGIHPMKQYEIFDMLYDYCSNLQANSWPLRQVILITHSPHLTEVIYNQRHMAGIRLYYFINRKQMVHTAFGDREMMVPVVVPLEVLAVEKMHLTNQNVFNDGAVVAC